MKRWNWKIIRRVLLILITISIVCNIASGCNCTKSAESYDESRPWLKLVWEDKEFPIDNVNLSLSIGLFLNTENPADLPNMARDMDSFYGAALYFCSADNVYALDYDFAGFPTLENHVLIREISAEEALSDKYIVKQGFFGRKTFRHTEQITIPKDLLTEYTDSVFIKLILVGIKDGQFVNATNTISIGLSYHFTDENHIRFTSVLME